MQRTDEPPQKPMAGSGIDYKTTKQSRVFQPPASNSSILFAQAGSVIETFPSMMTKLAKHKAQSQVLRLFLAALAASRDEMAV